ncbi:hypothetical protein [Streptomyces sp. NPDC059863]|uniref:AraC-like ligand-binding domain-containing protein n=1 Tax=unclassified Streptomyces TaxID=2593676 RepID=UPI0036468348
MKAPERYELFAEFTGRSHMPNRLRSNNQDDFRAAMRVLDLGELQISLMSFPHLEIARTAKLIRQSDPEAYQINCFFGHLPDHEEPRQEHSRQVSRR